MSLEKATEENLKVIMAGLAERLNVVNRALLDPEDYDISKYEDLKFMYEMIKSRNSLSPSETQAFIEELRKARK
ncbi:DUF1128 domain-containing protein [Aciduricibacillus chroicocephali]|uniref:DUF1128 domain-containing protein n=1 Tax=Aciduricibacillus chroicocephali TaxID=3054939 RepID=A0ABY9L1I6_9BACI|nr:DUF1128 domain-containing protein [Bacillaceae bacterium 44XB]